MTALNKAEIVAAHARGTNDTGSPEVQVALLTARINELTPTSRRTPRTTTVAAACCAW
jgi:ribosomal protein S15